MNITPPLADATKCTLMNCNVRLLNMQLNWASLLFSSGPQSTENFSHGLGNQDIPGRERNPQWKEQEITDIHKLKATQEASGSGHGSSSLNWLANFYETV